jgi:hypothetical protein
MRKQRLWRIGLSAAMILFVVLGVFLTLSRQQPRWRSPEILARFLGLTNDASGKKFARFLVKNTDDRAIEISLPGFVDLGMRGGGYFGFTNTMFRPGDTRETWIEAPTNRWNWRAEFICSHPLPWNWKIRNWAVQRGFPGAPIAQTGKSLYSDWVLDPVVWAGPSTLITNGTVRP